MQFQECSRNGKGKKIISQERSSRPDNFSLNVVHAQWRKNGRKSELLVGGNHRRLMDVERMLEKLILDQLTRSRQDQHGEETQSQEKQESIQNCDDKVGFSSISEESKPV